MHHYIPLSWVEGVNETEVRLNVISGEARAQWAEAGDGSRGD
jgi:hypothetical protein